MMKISKFLHSLFLNQIFKNEKKFFRALFNLILNERGKFSKEIFSAEIFNPKFFFN